MSTRERAKAILASAAWLIAVAITAALGDVHKMFVIVVSGAAVLTLNRIISAATHRSTTTVAAAVDQLKVAVDELRKVQATSPMPVQVVHQIGFKQGWEARDRQTLDDLSDLVAVFEKRFPAPPN